MRRVGFVVGLAISAAALYAAFGRVDTREVWSALGSARYGLVLGAIPVLFVLFLVRAYRWKLLFRPANVVSTRSAFGALQVGYMASSILPLQFGELARAYVLGERERVSKVQALSTIAVERVLDTIALLAIFGILLPFVDLPRVVGITGMLIFTGALVLASCLVVAARRKQWAARHVLRLARLLPSRFEERGRSWGLSTVSGLSALADANTLVAVLVWTFVGWATSAAVLFMLLSAFSLQPAVTAAFFLLVATTFGFLIPSSPSAIGVYHAVSIHTLTVVFGAPYEAAASYAIVAHAVYVIPPTLVGAVYLFYQQLSVGRIREWSAEEGESPETQTAIGPNSESISAEHLVRTRAMRAP